MKLTSFFIITLSLILLHADPVYAHGRYILPSHTILSGDKEQKVTMVASISNDFFHPDRALGDNGKGVVEGLLAGLFKILKTVVILPSGEEKPVSWQAFARASVADLELKQDGTYRVMSIQPSTLMTTFKKADGTPGRFFGEGQSLPEGATDVVKRLISSRVETYISKNAPDRKAMEVGGAGLVLGGESHPNDLFVDEDYTFSLSLNGKSLPQPAEIIATLEGTRYRNKRESIKLSTDENGQFTLNFPKAGMYLLEAEIALKSEKENIDMEHFSLYLTLEVSPQ